MNVTFYSFQKKANSTAQPTGGTTVSVQLKQPCDVLNPSLILKQTTRGNWNYAYIPAWGRYYFMSNITFLTGDRVQVDLSIDVLATYKTTIAETTTYVERCADEDAFNPLVEDPLIPTENNLYTTTTASTALTGLNTSGVYVLRTVSQDGSEAGVAAYAMSGTLLASVLDFMFDDGSYTDVISDETVKAFFNPFQYIVDLKWFPFLSTEITGTSTTVKFGWWDSKVIATLLSSYQGKRLYCDSLTLPANNYTDFRAYSDRFSHYQIYLPAVGTVPISALDIEDGLCLQCDVDMTTGQGLYKLYTGTLTDGANPTGALIASYHTQFSVPIQIGQMGATLANTVSSAVGTIASAASGNVLGAGEGLVQTAQAMIAPSASINGMQGNKYNFVWNGTVVVSLDIVRTAGEPRPQAGRPCMAQKVLGALSGFIKCGNASVDLYGTDQERDMVNNYLNSGFYME